MRVTLSFQRQARPAPAPEDAARRATWRGIAWVVGLTIAAYAAIWCTGLGHVPHPDDVYTALRRGMTVRQVEEALKLRRGELRVARSGPLRAGEASTRRVPTSIAGYVGLRRSADEWWFFFDPSERLTRVSRFEIDTKPPLEHALKELPPATDDARAEHGSTPETEDAGRG